MKKYLYPLLAVLLVSSIGTSKAEAQDMSTVKQKKTLRLLMPQWQGGDYDLNPTSGQIYPLGARLLAFLAPASDAPLIEVPVDAYNGVPRPKQNGVVWQEVVLRQVRAARTIIDEHSPDRIIMFGGDCHVSQAPFAYLNERYDGKVGLLWIDTHPDISTPENYDREHAMVLGNLVGKGDPVLAGEVKTPFKPEHVLLIGIDGFNAPYEEATVRELGLRTVPPGDIAENSEAVLRWIRDNAFEHVVIHLDLDSLDPKSFYSQMPMNPNGLPFDTVPGKITVPQMTRLIKDVSAAADVACISFAEHMPWDAYNLKTMMEEFSFMK